MTHPALTAQSRWMSPLGGMTLAATNAGLAGLWFDGQAHHPGPLGVPDDAGQPWLRAAREQLEAYFAGRLRRFDLPLDLSGTPFQQAVWQALQRIDSGSTRSYAQIAQAAGSPAGVRAAGAAIGRNPVSVIVPCHRVVGGGGQLTGYAGGLPRKQALLSLEGCWDERLGRPRTRLAATAA
jgi:methylated-DNA-[protein]-cysteine S-methyltransferase